MKDAAPHSFAAWCLDVWLISSVMRPVAGSLPADGPAAVVIGSACPLVLILVLALHHAGWSKTARFLTFGEAVLGRVFIDARKIWRNPYGTSRGLLYGCLAYGLFVRFTVLSDGSGGTSPDLLVSIVLIVIATVSMILLGRGHAWALAGVVAHRALERTASMPPLEIDSIGSLTWFLLGVHGETIFFAVVCAAIVHHYAVSGRVSTTVSTA